MALTIEDYKKMYEEARAAGDAAGMQAANDAANALRASMGLEAEYATEDIAKTAAQSSGSASYTPLNATSASGINQLSYENEVADQQQYIADNPTAIQAYSAEELYAKYGDIIDSTVRTGYYTQDAAAAQAAADLYGVSVTPTTYNGQSGWYLVGRAERPVQEGSSGADEGLLNDYDYAIIQKLKQDFAAAQAQYNAAVAAGDTAAAAAAQQAMDTAHLEAERIRTAYGYSGGQDGSLYITNGALGVSGSGSAGGSGGSSGGAGYGSLTVPQGSNLTGMVGDYSSYLEQMYAARKSAALAELNAAYQKNLAALDRAEQGIGEQYQTARNNTAGASELAKRNFAEYAAATGLNSGTGGQAELARNVTLQNNLNTINTAEADTISDLQLQRANAEIEYNNAIAQAQATGDYELAAALYQEKVRVQTALLEMEIQQQKFALQQYQLEYQAQRDAVSDQQWASELAFQQQKYLSSLT
ncbi:MAG: hypothetical protein ACI3XJ_12085 [Oscillospiraceae bacterium]